MDKIREKEEYLEKLWYMKEENNDSLEALKTALSDDYKADAIDELSYEGLVNVREGNTKIGLTSKGEDIARRLIRAHRLAERLLHDLFGGDFESGACEFEHIVTPELIDGICTLLGHPKECPHGMPIPEGECCSRSARTAERSVIPLTELEIGQAARVAYVNCRDDRRLHKIDGLHIRPGIYVKLHQIYPTYVIECEGANIALDNETASNICLWKEPQYRQAAAKGMAGGMPKRSGAWIRGFRFRNRKAAGE